jgi:hypothetical protein
MLIKVVYIFFRITNIIILYRRVVFLGFHSFKVYSCANARKNVRPIVYIFDITSYRRRAMKKENESCWTLSMTNL